MSDLNDLVGQEEAPQSDEPEAQAPEEVEQAEPTGEEAATPAEQAPDDPIETHRKGLETAVVAERRKRQEAEARTQAIERQLQELMRGQQQAQASPGAPDPAEFQDNPQEYWRQLARFEAREELKAEKAREAEERKKSAEVDQQRKFQEAASEAVKAGQSEFPDFDAVINNGLAPFMSPLLQQALVMTKGGHKVAYYLGKNPLDAARIAEMDPAQMLIELGEIRAKSLQANRPAIPRTLTTARDARGQYAQSAFDGPTPLDSILSRKN